MIIKHKFTMHLDRKEKEYCMDVMQDDRYSRDLELTLKANMRNFAPPEGCVVLIRYQHENGQGGMYDVLPDGTPAYAIQDNLLTVRLAPQVCAVPGKVRLTAVLIRDNAELHCFSVCVNVHGVEKKGGKNGGYYDIRHFLPQPKTAVKGQYLRVTETDSQGRIIAMDTASEVGKSAYEYAKEGGFAGTEADFARKMADTSSGIHIGANEPESEGVSVWIDTDEEAPESGGVDVTASVGQTIMVEEVDANGKPTKWKAAEYQERTHYSTYEEVKLLDNVTFSASDDNILDFPIVVGQSYRVICNGITYEDVGSAFNVDGVTGAIIGNLSMIGGEDNEKPYVFLYMDGIGTQYMSMMDTDDTVTLYTNQETVHQIPQKYVPNMRPYYVFVYQNGGEKYETQETVESFINAVNSGRAIYAKVFASSGGVMFVPLFYYSYDSGMAAAGFAISTYMLNLMSKSDGTFNVTMVNNS